MDLLATQPDPATPPAANPVSAAMPVTSPDPVINQQPQDQAVPAASTMSVAPVADTAATSSAIPTSSEPTDLNDEILDQDILKILGAENLPEEEKKELYQTLLGTLENRALIRIDDTLDSNDIEDWKKAIDTGDVAQMQTFLASKGIDFPKLLLSEALLLKTELAEMAQATYLKPSDPAKTQVVGE